jgi:hypothetical protein
LSDGPLRAPHWITGAGAIVGRLKNELKEQMLFDENKNVMVIVPYEWRLLDTVGLVERQDG